MCTGPPVRTSVDCGSYEANVVTVPKLTGNIDWEVFAQHVESMSKSDALTDGCVYFLRGCSMVIADSLRREMEANAQERRVPTRDAAVGRGRVSNRDLMTEVERVLTKASGAMSLYERL